MDFRKLVLFLMSLLYLTVCQLAEAGVQRDLQGRYELVQVLMLSRHNIRAPLVDSGMLTELTEHQWHDFGVASGQLTAHGGQVEEAMGRYARFHLQQEGLLPAGFEPGAGEIYFYANAIARTVDTARHFAKGMFPGVEVPVTYKGEVGDADPVFWPGMAGHTALFDERLKREVAVLGGSETITMSVAPGIKAAAAVLDNPEAQKGEFKVTVEDGLQLGGSLRPLMKACDALSLQYYELGDNRASFGHELSFREWQELTAVKELGIHVYRHVPTYARAVARPLLEVFQEELGTPGRKFTFLCGHDTNVAALLGALEVQETSLPEAIEQEAPIGCKLVVERWQDKAGADFVALKLVYPSVYQLCSELPIDMRHPPQALTLHLQGLEANEAGLIPLQAFIKRLREAVRSDEMLMEQ